MNLLKQKSFSVNFKSKINYAFLAMSIAVLMASAGFVPLELIGIKLVSPISRCVFDQVDAQNVVLEVDSSKSYQAVNIELTKGKFGHRCPRQRADIFKRVYKPNRDNKIIIDFAPLETGYYHITAKTTAGKKIGSWEITKYPYKKNSVLIRNSVPYYNGEPFLMIGLFHTSDPVVDIISTENQQGISSEMLTRDKMLKSVKERGFNTVHYSWYVGSKEFYQAAARYGLMVVSESRKELGNVAELIDQPNIFGWYALDEPHESMASACTVLYEVYKQTDPYHPVMTAFYNEDPFALFGNTPMIDIAVPDPYLITGPDPDFTRITDRVESCKKMLSYDPATCVFIAPQLFTATNIWNGFEPTYDQMRSQVYTAVLAGAKGVFYYSYYTHELLTDGMSLNPKRKHWFLPESNLWDSIGRLNAELIKLKT